MAKFASARYPQLNVYDLGVKFVDGVYETDDEDTITALRSAAETLQVTEVAEAPAVETEDVPEDVAAVETAPVADKPATKRPATRKDA